MTKAIVVHEYGGPEALVWEDVEVSTPGPGQARIRHTAIGLNFIDIYFRTGFYPLAERPGIIGMEGAGIVEEVGEGVTVVAPGDRVVYGDLPLGAYAEARLIAADQLFKLPDAVDDKVAAATMVRGMTTEYLLYRTYKLKAGDTILVHAAAGGLGLLMCQWAKHLGATVIGTAGSEEKCALARANGCDYPINYRTEDFVARVMEITNGEKLPVVFDSVGKDTFMGSLDCLRKRGLMVACGQSSGGVEPIDVNLLQQKGSLYLTRPTLFGYVTNRADLEASAGLYFDLLAKGVLNAEVHQTYALKDAGKAHVDLEERRTTGAGVLLP